MGFDNRKNSAASGASGVLVDGRCSQSYRCYGNESGDTESIYASRTKKGKR